MVSLFASKSSSTPPFLPEDVSYLIQHFPPPSTSTQLRTLVRSRSGNHLIRTQTVSQQLKEILDYSQERVDLSALPRLLGIEDVQWLLEQRGRDLYYSKDRRSLVTVSEVSSLKDRILETVDRAFIYVEDLASELDLTLVSLEALINTSAEDVRNEDDESGRSVLCSQTLFESVERKIDKAIREANASGQSCNLTTVAPDANVPTSILRAITTKAIAKLTAGGLEASVNEVVFVPASAVDAQQAEQDLKRKTAIERYLGLLEDVGYCLIDPSQSASDKTGQEVLDQEVLACYSRTRGRDSVATIPINDTSQPKAIASSTLLVVHTLQQRVEYQMASQARQLAERAWHERKGAYDVAFVEKVATSALSCIESTGLAQMLVRSDRRKVAEEAFHSEIVERRARLHAQFHEYLAKYLLAPLQLYIAGTQTLMDETLEKNVSEFVTDYLRREVVPEAIAPAKATMLADRSAERDVEKLSSATAEARSLTDIQTALSKFARKQKISLPPDDTIFMQVKRSALESKVKAMRKMVRPSDLLQNLTWVLLGEKCDGLFISSGKDTTRMIKQYRAVGDAEVADSLERIRDALKSGHLASDAVEKMRGMAQEAVLRFCGPAGGPQE